jgi:hypothetical protein
MFEGVEYKASLVKRRGDIYTREGIELHNNARDILRLYLEKYQARSGKNRMGAEIRLINDCIELQREAKKSLNNNALANVLMAVALATHIQHEDQPYNNLGWEIRKDENNLLVMSNGTTRANIPEHLIKPIFKRTLVENTPPRSFLPNYHHNRVVREWHREGGLNKANTVLSRLIEMEKDMDLHRVIDLVMNPSAVTDEGKLLLEEMHEVIYIVKSVSLRRTTLSEATKRLARRV